MDLVPFKVIYAAADDMVYEIYCKIGTYKNKKSVNLLPAGSWMSWEMPTSRSKQLHLGDAVLAVPGKGKKTNSLLRPVGMGISWRL